MASTSERLPQNIFGRYYVERRASIATSAAQPALAFFTRDEEIGLSVVHRQPETSEELALAEEARESCPQESIGNGVLTPSPKA